MVYNNHYYNSQDRRSLGDELRTFLTCVCAQLGRTGRRVTTTTTFQFRTWKRYQNHFQVWNYNVIIVTSRPVRPSCAQTYEVRNILNPLVRIWVPLCNVIRNITGMQISPTISFGLFDTGMFTLYLCALSPLCISKPAAILLHNIHV